MYNVGSNDLRRVANNSGGPAFRLDEWARLDRFLILGVEGNTYYESRQALTEKNAQNVVALIQRDGVRVVTRTAEVSDAGRAARNEAAILVLALALKYGNAATKQAVVEHLPQVVRTGTHALHFANYIQQTRGWGRAPKRAVKAWFDGKTDKELAFQMLKYRQRDGWTMGDLLRVTRPVPTSDTRNALYNWAVNGWPGVGSEPHADEALRQIWAYERLQAEPTTANAVKLITDYALPREAIPTQLLKDTEVWAALFERLPIGATLDNLVNMSVNGLLKPFSPYVAKVAERICNEKALKGARVHPLEVLKALKVYGEGKSYKRGQTAYSWNREIERQWDVVPGIMDALNDAFYLAFTNVQPTGKRQLLALDVSGSMTTAYIGSMPNLSAREASAAMAMVTVAAETPGAVHTMGFSHQLVQIALSKKERLDDVTRRIDRIPMGGTDIGLPMVWAFQNNVDVDAFLVYTDSETNYGTDPQRALDAYRQKIGHDVKLIVVGMTATEFSVGDPYDSRVLNVVGFDTNAPALMSEFVAGRL